LMESWIPLVNGVGGWDEEHDMGVSGDGAGGNGALDALVDKLESNTAHGGPSQRQRRRRRQRQIRARRMMARKSRVEGEGGEEEEGEEEEGEEEDWATVISHRKMIRRLGSECAAVLTDCDAPKSGLDPGDPGQRTLPRRETALSDMERVIAEKHHKIENNMLPFPLPEDIQRTPLSDLDTAIAEKQNTISNDMYWPFPGQGESGVSRPAIPEPPPLPTQADLERPRPARPQWSRPAIQERPWWTPSDLERVVAEKHHEIENDMLPFPFPEDIERTRSDLKAIAEKQNTISNDMWSFPGQVDVQRSRPVIPEAPPLLDMGAVRYARPPRAPTVGEEKGVVEVHWEASLDDEWWDMAEDVDQGEDDDIYSLISDGEGWQL
jgi:hypothetical protein